MCPRAWKAARQAARSARALDGPPDEWRPSARALKPADGVWGHRKRAAREAREHCTGPQMSGRPSARALKPADGVWGHRKRAARVAREHWTGPQMSGRPSARALMPADGAWGHRKRAARVAREHWTGPQMSQMNSGAITSVIVLSSLISTCRLGPAVSLNGSPTVSPTMAALWASEPFPPYSPVSMNFLALSHAPPPLFRSVAIRMPVIVPTMSNAATASAPTWKAARKTTPTTI